MNTLCCLQVLIVKGNFELESSIRRAFLSTVNTTLVNAPRCQMKLVFLTKSSSCLCVLLTPNHSTFLLQILLHLMVLTVSDR